MDKQKSIEILWNYLKMNHKVTNVDLIIVFGCHDLQVAYRGCNLFLDNIAPKILFTGGLGRITSKYWNKIESEKFSEIALEKGIPKNKILIENKSSNTGENIEFTKKLLKNKKIEVRKILAVHKPYMERRTYAAIKKKWSDIDVVVTSPQENFYNYCKNIENDGFSQDMIINIMVRDLQRIDAHYKNGFQIYQEIPDEAWEAYKYLVEIGYDKQLLKQ
jgi:uncharacterized SAM-binding protein YcdF (DUF218 family)